MVLQSLVKKLHKSPSLEHRRGEMVTGAKGKELAGQGSERSAMWTQKLHRMVGRYEVENI